MLSLFFEDQCAAMFSIKKEFSDKIFLREKKFEFRKVKCSRPIKRVFVYESRSSGSIVGEFEVANIIDGNLLDVWNQTKDFAGISFEFYCSYYANATKAVAYKIRNPIRYSKLISLKDFGLTRAPQSFFYINDEQIIEIDRIISKIS